MRCIIRRLLAWLQSTRSPAIALPVVSAHAFGEKYPDVSIEPAVTALGLGEDSDDVASTVVRSGPARDRQPVGTHPSQRDRVRVPNIIDALCSPTRELFIREQEPEQPKAAQ